jgi:hypothetical protein
MAPVLHVLAGSLLCVACVAPAATGTAAARPNVLYIVSDDLRAELPGAAYGHDNVHAPNLAKLAEESLVFDAAFCNQPVCSPSRNSFMSGKWLCLCPLRLSARGACVYNIDTHVKGSSSGDDDVVVLVKWW